MYVIILTLIINEYFQAPSGFHPKQSQHWCMYRYLNDIALQNSKFTFANVLIINHITKQSDYPTCDLNITCKQIRRVNMSQYPLATLLRSHPCNPVNVCIRLNLFGLPISNIFNFYCF
jgi:hypothetical protein